MNKIIYGIYFICCKANYLEIVEEQFNTLVESDNESDATKKALEELSEEYVVKNLDSRLIEVELCPDFTSFDEWEEKYTALKNPKSDEDDEGLSAIMFETYGEELNYIQTEVDIHIIWTWVDGDEGSYLVAGYHIVNRIGYFVTEKMWDDEDIVITYDTYGEATV